VFHVSVVVGAAVPAAVYLWGAVPALSWWGEVSLGCILIIDIPPPFQGPYDMVHTVLKVAKALPPSIVLI